MIQQSNNYVNRRVKNSLTGYKMGDSISVAHEVTERREKNDKRESDPRKNS